MHSTHTLSGFNGGDCGFGVRNMGDEGEGCGALRFGAMGMQGLVGLSVVGSGQTVTACELRIQT